MIEMRANEDNFITVAELMSALQKIKDKNAKIVLFDNEYSGRALQEDDLYYDEASNSVYLGCDI
jgi:hypothetical protein